MRNSEMPWTIIVLGTQTYLAWTHSSDSECAVWTNLPYTRKGTEEIRRVDAFGSNGEELDL